MKLNRTYEQSKDLHVRNYIVYGKTADKKLYYESDYKTQVSKSDMVDAFNKGALLIVDGSKTVVPIVLTGSTVKTIDSNTSLEFVTWSSLDAG